MIAKVYSACACGIESCLIEVEVDLSTGLPQTTIVGLPDQAVKESKERVKSAIKNSGFSFSPKKLTVNLAPADLKKEGPSFDLAIAVGILAVEGHVNPKALPQFLFLGELALDGALRKIKGALPAATLVKKINRILIIPEENASETALEKDAQVFRAKNLFEVVRFLNQEIELPKVSADQISTHPSKQNIPDFSEVRGQWYAKRALEVACAGNHNILLIGQPGAGKTMLAQRIPGILPPLMSNQSIEISKIYSVAGLLEEGIIETRPFRAPHHTVSQIGLVGGGSFPRPGEISLAHNGVLFLDEFPEFRRDSIESLRSPLEEGRILISRAKQNLIFPSRFLLVCAMNPCPCGFLTSKHKACRCSLSQIQKYLHKISGPILDRIDIHIELPAVEYKDLVSVVPSESSAEIKKRILGAREIQRKRFQDFKFLLNSEMNPREVKKFCVLQEKSKQLLEQAMKELHLSARGYFKIVKIARTIADLAASDLIQLEHIAEALQYRALDRQYFH